MSKRALGGFVALLVGLGVACKVRVGDPDLLFGKSGLEYYTEAKASMDQGDWATAAILLGGSAALHKNAVLRHAAYVDDWERLADRVNAQAKAPVKVATDPPVDIYALVPMTTREDAEFYPHVKYVLPAGVSLADGSAVDAFSTKLHATLIARFPGFKTKFHHVVYTAFSEPPTNSLRVYERFGTVIDTATGQPTHSRK